MIYCQSFALWVLSFVLCQLEGYKNLLKLTSMFFRVFLTFWETLAHIAFQHVEKGSRIYVCGRLLADVVESDDGKDLTYYKVFFFFWAV